MLELSNSQFKQQRTAVPLNSWIALLLFAGVLLFASLQLLAASGHFPKERRVAVLQGGGGAAILYGSMFITLAAVILAIAIAWASMPWYAAVLGGGIAVLSAPMLLPKFSDDFVDGIPALLVFALGAGLALGLMHLLR